MTITTNPSRDEYTSTAGQTVFNYTFKIYANTDLDVYVTPSGQSPDDSADLTTDYVVDTGTIGDEAGGFITFNTPLNNGDAVTIVSAIPYDRTVDYQNNGDFLPATVNNDNDRQVSQIKQILEQTGRTLQFQESLQGASTLSLPNPVSQNLLRWKTDLSGLENVKLSEVDSELIPLSDLVLRIDTTVAILLDTISPSAFESDYYDTNKINGSSAKWIKTGSTGAPGTTDFSNGVLYNANGDEYLISLPNNTLSVEQFGALGGANDDGAIFQQCLDFEPSTLIFTGGYTSSTTQSKDLSNKGINIVGRQNANIRYTATAPYIGMSISGSIESGNPLLADVSEGDRTLTTNESLAVGDLFRIESTDLWVTADAGVKSEYAKVSGVSGTTITLEWPLYDSYTAATTTIRKINPAKVNISDLEIFKDKATGLEAVEGLVLNYISDSVFERVKVRNFTQTNFEIGNSYNIDVRHCETYGEFFVGEGQGYGLAIISSQDFNVDGGSHVGGRHGITTGGDKVIRNLVIDGVKTSSEGAKSLDNHANQANVVIKNCDIRRGLSVFVQSAKVVGNTIRGDLQVQPVKSGGCISIHDNEGNEGTLEVSSFTNAGSVTTKHVSIRDNCYFTSDDRAFRLNSSTQAGDDWEIEKFDLKDNYFNTSDTNVTCGEFRGNTSSVTISNVNIINNEFFSATGKAFEIQESNFNINNLNFSDNKCEVGDSSKENTTLKMSSALATTARIKGNKFTDGVHGCLFNCYGGNLFLGDNTFKDSDVSFTTNAAPDFSAFLSDSNFEINVTNGWGAAIQPQAIADFGTGNKVKRVVWRSGAPTSGAWARGSVVYRTTPSAGGKMGWVATTNIADAAADNSSFKEFGVIDA